MDHLDLLAEFSEEFGVPQTVLLVRAAKQHEANPGPIGDTIKTPGFKGDLSRVITWQCVSKPENAKLHSITIDPAKFKRWVRDNAGLTFADTDFFGYMANAYDGFLKED